MMMGGGNPPYGPPRIPQGPVLSAGVAPTNLGVMGQGMIPALQHRTIIPNADDELDLSSSSGFSFIGGAGTAHGTNAHPQQNGGEGDAFSFVKEAMKSST